MSTRVCDEVHRSRIRPDVSPVEFRDDRERLLGGGLVLVLQRGGQEVLHLPVERLVAPGLVRALDVGYDVPKDHHAKLLVLASEELEEEGQELRGGGAAPVPQEDERGYEGAAQVRVEQGVVLLEELDEADVKGWYVRLVRRGHLREEADEVGKLAKVLAGLQHEQPVEGVVVLELHQHIVAIPLRVALSLPLQREEVAPAHRAAAAENFL